MYSCSSMMQMVMRYLIAISKVLEQVQQLRMWLFQLLQEPTVTTLIPLLTMTFMKLLPTLFIVFTQLVHSKKTTEKMYSLVTMFTILELLVQVMEFTLLLTTSKIHTLETVFILHKLKPLLVLGMVYTSMIFQIQQV